MSAGAGRSSARRMARTPGMASAALVSTLRTRACGMGLSSSLAKSIPSARKSSAYFALPVTLATQIRRDVVLSDELRDQPRATSRESSAPRWSAVRILS